MLVDLLAASYMMIIEINFKKQMCFSTSMPLNADTCMALTTEESGACL